MKQTEYRKALNQAAKLRAEAQAKVRELHAAGMRPAHIATEVGMSPQRVHQILWPKGKGTKANGKKANGRKPKRSKAKPALTITDVSRKGALALNAMRTKEERSQSARHAALVGAAKRRAKAEAGP